MLRGWLLKTAVIESPLYNLNVADLADGAYIYAVENKEGKLVKQDKFNVLK
jgi:hypothetical protein